MTKDNDDVISVSATQYEGTDFPFTNCSPHSVEIWGMQFLTAEHAYQYKKHVATNPELAERIRLTSDPLEAKRLAWATPIDKKNWDAVRQTVMLEILSAKYNQHPCIRKALSATGNRAIIQENDGEDNFWGIGKNGNGRNTMGKLWMMVREISLVR